MQKHLMVPVLVLSGYFGHCLTCPQEGQSPDKLLKVRRIELVDERGNTRMELSVDGTGNPSLRMFDNKDKPRLSFNVDKESNSTLSFKSPIDDQSLTVGTQAGQPAILFSKGTVLRCGLTMTPDGSAGLLMQDKQGSPALRLRTGGTGDSTLQFLGDDKEPRLALSHSAQGASATFSAAGGKNRVCISSAATHSSLFLTDLRNSERLSLGCAGKSGPFMMIRDDKERARIKQVMDDEGRATLAVLDSALSEVIGMSEGESGTRISIAHAKDPRGKLQLEVNSAGEAGVALFRSSDRFADVALGANKEGPQLIFGLEGNPRIGLAVSSSRTGIQVIDNNKVRRLFLGTTAEGTPSFELYDRVGKGSWKTPE